MYFSSFILKNLTRRPIRTSLTVLGLAVAVGSMIALLGISDNVERGVTDSFERRGVDLVAMEKGKPNQTDSDIDEKIVERVLQIEGIESVDVALAGLIDVTRGSGATIPALSFGWPPSNGGFKDLKILQGRKLEAGDVAKAMLGFNIASHLKMNVGDQVVLQGEPFEVIGVFESFTVFENGAVITLLDEAQRLASRPNRISGFSVRVKKSTGDLAAKVEDVRLKIEALKDSDGRPTRIAAQTVRDYVDDSSHIKILRALVWMVSVIAIAISIISMLNTMVMAVLERTQEIGILRAIGWTRARIIKMILGESILIGLAAGVIGTIGALVATHTLAASPRVSGFIEPGVSFRVILQGFALTALIGILGGAYPAFRAARLLPTEAIRHD